jgi:hypothetical protein
MKPDKLTLIENLSRMAVARVSSSGDFALADASGENGRSYFHRLSRFYPGYTPSETDRQFDNCLKAHGHGITVKTLFHLVKQAGISISAASKPARQGSVPKSAISSISSISSPEEIEEIEDFDSEQMPTFSESVTDILPSLLLQIVAKAVSPEDADLLLLGSLATFSACLPNVYDIYGSWRRVSQS